MAVLPAVKMNWMYVLWYPVWQRHSSEKTEEVEQIVRVEPQGYVGIYHADEE